MLEDQKKIKMLGQSWSNSSRFRLTFSSRTQFASGAGLADRVRHTVVVETDLLNVLNLFKDRGRYV